MLIAQLNKNIIFHFIYLQELESKIRERFDQLNNTLQTEYVTRVYIVAENFVGLLFVPPDACLWHCGILVLSEYLVVFCLCGFY